MANFVFEDLEVDDKYYTVARLGKYYYHLDNNTGKILFKTKYKFELFDYNFFKFIIGNQVYITNKEGFTLFKTDLETFNSYIKDYEPLQEFTEKEKSFDKFKSKGYDSIYKVCYVKSEYYIVKKDNLYALVDGDNNIVIDFKYSFLWDIYSVKKDELLFIARDLKTNKVGIIDINENIIIPFIYDEIHNWSVDISTNTMIAEKDGLHGVIDTNGRILIDFRYKWIFGYLEFENYTFAQDKNGLWGVINKKGTPVSLDLSQIKEVNATTLRKKINSELCERLNHLSAQIKLHNKVNTPSKTTRKKKVSGVNKNQLKLKL